MWSGSFVWTNFSEYGKISFDFLAFENAKDITFNYRKGLK